MFIVFALIDGHFLLTLELKIVEGYQPACRSKTWARYFAEKIFVFIDALKYSTIPFFTLLILSIFIIQRVFRAEDISAQLQNRHQLCNNRQCSTTSSLTRTVHSPTLPVSTGQSNIQNSNTRVGRRVTFMLLSVSIAFCVLSAPISFMQIVHNIAGSGYHETSLAIGKAIAELCQYVNHSCNFFLYALTGRIFRREFVRVFFPTRFGGRRDNGSAAGINNRHSLRVRACPFLQTAPSLNRRGFIYSMED